MYFKDKIVYVSLIWTKPISMNLFLNIFMIWEKKERKIFIIWVKKKIVYL